MSKLAVVAIGGNSLIKDEAHQSVPDQFNAVRETAVHIAGMIEQGLERGRHTWQWTTSGVYSTALRTSEQSNAHCASRFMWGRYPGRNRIYDTASSIQ